MFRTRYLGRENDEGFLRFCHILVVLILRGRGAAAGGGFLFFLLDEGIFSSDVTVARYRDRYRVRTLFTFTFSDGLQRGLCCCCCCYYYTGERSLLLAKGHFCDPFLVHP